ncbi:hypothetical protein [Micromonospora sp. KLBMP9576]|uniref:hypothetical protein n=1 Tax=Micromonospora sp. KLBMP9576 TaxID=3424769 RepID=UPI003D9472E7
MDGRDPERTVNIVTGDVSGHLIQAGAISGGVHIHVPSRRVGSARSRAAERPSWLARLSGGGLGLLVDQRRIVVVGSVPDEVLVDLPFGGPDGRPAAAVQRGPHATLLELTEPVDVVAAPLAAPTLSEGHAFVTHGFPDGAVGAGEGGAAGVADTVQGVLGGPVGPGGQLFGVRVDGGPWPATGFAGAPVFDRDVDAVVGLLAPHPDGARVLPLALLLRSWPWLWGLLGWRLDHDPAVRTHWLARARGSEIASDTGAWYFTGRVEARREICAWFAGGPPLLVVTGGPGTGKSAVLAHVLVGADERWAASMPTDGPRPTPGAVDVALHLRALTLDDVVARLAALCDVRATDPGELLVALRERRAAAGRAVTVLCDALDEAATVEESLRIARLLSELAGADVARVVVGVRAAPPGSLRSRVQRVWGASTPVIDLESERYLRRDDIVEYVARRIAAEDADGRYRDAERAARVAADVASRSRHNFLVAQLTSRWLLLPGVAAQDDGGGLPSTLGEAMEKYLDVFGPDRALVERVLTALAFATGSGLPRNELWSRVAEALSAGHAVPPAELNRVFDSAATYLVETSIRPDGTATYRLYHEVLDEHLRQNCVLPAPDRAVAKALRSTVALSNGHRAWADADPYVKSQLAWHAARAGALDELIVEGGFLVHADPNPLLAVLHEAESAPGRLAAACYRASSAVHRDLDAGARARVLALDAARMGARDLHAQLTGESTQWPVRFATGSRQHSALLATLHAGQGNISSIAAGTFDGRAVALSGSEGGRMRLWDVADQRPIGSTIAGLPWSAYQSPALALAELDGRLLAVAGGGNRVQIWDLLAARLIAERRTGPADAIHGVAVTRLDGRPVWISVGHAGMHVWDLRGHDLLAGPIGENLYGLAVTELDGVPLAITGGFSTVRVWDLRTAGPAGPAMDAGAVFHLAVTEVAGRCVIVTGSADETGMVRLWDLRTRREIAEPRADHGWSVSGVAVAELAGRPVAVTSAGHNQPGPDDEDTTLIVWDLTDLSPLGRPLTGHTGGTQAVAVTDVDGRPVAVTGGGWDGSVRLWDLTLAEQRLGDPARGHGQQVVELAVLDGGSYRLALSVGLDHTAFLWDLRERRAIARATVNFTTAAGIDERDGRLFVLLAGIGFARIWHPGGEASVPLHTRDPSEPLFAASVAAGTTGRRGGRPIAALVSDGKLLRLYDLATGRTLGRPIAVDSDDERRDTIDRPAAVALLQVGARPAAVVLSGHRSAGDIFVAGLWDLADGTLLARIAPAASPAVATAVVDGRPVVVLAEAGGALRVWDAVEHRVLRTIATGTGTVHFLASGVLAGRPVMLAAGYAGPVVTVDLGTGAVLDEILLPDTCRGLALGERGTLVVGIGNDIAIIETEIEGVVPRLGTPSRPRRREESMKWSTVAAVAVVSSALAAVINLATESPASWPLWVGVVVLTVVSAGLARRAAGPAAPVRESARPGAPAADAPVRESARPDAEAADVPAGGDAGRPDLGVFNRVDGDVSGTVVQARDISGGVRLPRDERG